VSRVPCRIASGIGGDLRHQWHNTQEGLQLTSSRLGLPDEFANAYSRASRQEFEALLTQHLSAQVSYTYDKTKLTSLNPLFVSPNVSGATPGDRQSITRERQVQRWRSPRVWPCGAVRW